MDRNKATAPEGRGPAQDIAASNVVDRVPAPTDKSADSRWAEYCPRCDSTDCRCDGFVPPRDGDGDVQTKAVLDSAGLERDGLLEPEKLTLTPASAIKMDRPRWVWDLRIPVGGTTLMPGREGLGKTLIVCHLAARLTRGQLAGEWRGRKATIIYVGHEDDRATVLVPRLVAAGADLDRFLFVDIPAGGTFGVNVNTEELTARARDRDVALVVVDPLDSHLGPIDTHKKAEVQSAIRRLADLAQDLRCGALGIAHFSKAPSFDVLTKVVGSVGFTTSVRSVLAVGEHPKDAGERVCVLAKANMTDRTQVPALRFACEGVTVPHPDGGDIDTGRVAILGEEDGIDPNSILVGDSEERGALDEACNWLESMLSDGGVGKKEITTFARAEGITRITLDRAAKRIGVISERDDSQQGRPATWSLPGYVSRVSSQEGVRHNPQPSDQGKQGESGGFVSRSDDETKPDISRPEDRPGAPLGDRIARAKLATCSYCNTADTFYDDGAGNPMCAKCRKANA